MPLQATSGAASYDAFGGGVPAAPPVYIEDVMSTWLYTGTGAAQTITNGIDLSTKGGLVWLKRRDGVGSNWLQNTVAGIGNELSSNSTAATAAQGFVTSVSTTGFTVDTALSASANTYASWTFRKQPKFFDVVTFTQSGTSGYQTINHSLGSAPAVIMIKGVGQADGWFVYHRSIPTQVVYLNQTNAAANFTLSNSVTSTTFNFNLTDFGFGNGATYIAYLFAHDAGGFGLTGTDNVISCGTWTGNTTVNLGYEPQWVLIKRTDSTSNWFLLDVMRGWTAGGILNFLLPNSSAAESTDAQPYLTINSTGFAPGSDSYFQTGTFIYIAIRRGPMKVPTTGTSVFAPTAFTSNNSGSQVISVGFPPDTALVRERTTTANTASQWPIGSRLTGTGYLRTTQTNAEVTFLDMVNGWDDQNSIDLAGVIVGNGNFTEILYNFRRAPSFFDVVCYTGTGADPQTVAHNLGKAPELMIFKARDVAAGWRVWGGNMAITEYLALSETSAVVTGSTFFGSTLPTATSFYVGSGLSVSARTIVAYLFATCAGVSKVGSYTGTAATLQIDCGFTGGARFVLIKRTDSAADWYVWDTARGIVSGNDPYLLLNSTAAEVTNTDYIDTYSAGFEISSTAPAAINASGGTYIFLAIA